MFLLFKRIMLTKKQLALISCSFDMVGDILIFSEFPQELIKKEKEIGNYLLKKFKHIKVIAKKTHFHSGKYRTKKIKIIAGEKRKTTIHKESGCLLKLDVEKCYFSPRLSNERLRIAKQVKKNESILVLFSGVSPFSCVIAKHKLVKKIYDIEINPIAHGYATENIILNKLLNIQLLQGDVIKVLPTIKGRFDRIIMPLPKLSHTYLDLVIKKLKKKGIIHIYTFFKKDNLRKQATDLIRLYIKDFKIKKVIKCGAYSPYLYRICIDVQVV